ncbi:major facilitator superfamily domain-containing protein [Spinellus fusiger]|nr:major facilitator superfamily domain-containing protein [Spinellus fusiger]
MMKNLFYQFNTPLYQVVLLGFICLCGPGMLNALAGLGAGGSMSSDVGLVDTSNSALYSCFAIVGFFAGSITNTIGVKKALMIGSIGYVFYSFSFWIYEMKKIPSLVIAAGALLGCCAGIFWSAQGAVMMSYPEEKNKGKYVALFWTLFNIGGILGSIITLGLNLQNITGGVSSGTYATFAIVMLVGVFSTFAFASPSNVICSDGSKMIVMKSTHWRDEVKSTLMIWKDWRIMALIPAFLASNWFYAYQFHVNAVYFDPSTRALNDLMYWTFQIFGSLALGILLDYQGMSRRNRGLVGLGVLFTTLMTVYAGGFVFQLTFENNFNTPIHWNHPTFGGPFVLFIMYGLSDSLYQSYLYWLMGAMTNDPNLLARYAGFYKAVQSAGAAISFGIDAINTPLRTECFICWSLISISFPLIYLVAKDITETNITIVLN